MVSAIRERNFSVVPEKKLNEVKAWFEEHFIRSQRRDYLRRSPYLVLQGPTGCGKTTTLEWIAEELDLTIKEYSETTDTSLIQFELRNSNVDRDDNQYYNNTTLSIDRRRSHIFENFVINHVRYETLYADNHSAVDHDDDAADEFDDDDDFVIPPELSSSSRLSKAKLQPKGVIIHIESPLAFGRTTSVLIQCLRRLKKTIRELSVQCPRRVAIVFEAVDGNDYVMSLSSSVKINLDIEVFKLNPVTRINMKKFIESELRNYNYDPPDKITLEQLIDDSDGDVSACKNTLRLICRRDYSSYKTGTLAINDSVLSSRDQKIDQTMDWLSPIQVSKRLKVEDCRRKRLIIHPKLMRDISRGSSFFHILGKIFFQRRYYPEKAIHMKPPRKIDRPYETENTTEHLVDLVDSEPSKLNSWLHQNYSRYCANDDIEKAALFLENLSSVDTMSLDSTQSTQYYESHQFIDHVQKHVAIEATVFSLYEDTSMIKKSNEKKLTNQYGDKMILKSSSASNWQLKTDSSYQGFAKPTGLIISKLSNDHQALLERYSSKMTQIFGRPYDRNDLLLDYAPYAKILLDRSALNLDGDEHLPAITREIQQIDNPDDEDFEQKHETLLDLIDRCDSQKVKEESGDVLMDES